MKENFTPRLEKILKNGKKEALRIGSAFLEPEHAIIALTQTETGTAIAVLKATNVPMDKIREALGLKLASIRPNDAPKDKNELKFSEELNNVLTKANELAEQSKNEYTGTEHFLIAALKSEGSLTASCFKELGIDVDGVIKSLMEEIMPKEGEQPAKIPAGGQKQTAKTSESVLKKYSINLNERATEGKIDPVVGRTEEISRLCKILVRKKKNNPVLVGPAGVGKTSVVEGLALRIVEKNVPKGLLDKQVYALDLTQVVAGTVYRGEFEERMKRIMTEVRDNPNYIVFLDELHMIIGAGSADSMDASNILKPALARGDFRCIGATTTDEYKRYIERDAALERRFQSIKVDEPSIQDTITIVKGARKSYETFHGVVYPDPVLEEIVQLSSRYIPSRNQPDKSFDIMDEIGAARKLKAIVNPEEREKLAKELSDIQQAKAEAIARTDVDEHCRIKRLETTVQHKLNKLAASDSKELTATKDDVYEVIQSWTGIPVGNLTVLQAEKLVNLSEELGQDVIGQATAVAEVAKVIKKSRTLLKDPQRPIGGFMFVGPTGVGKTLLAKTIAEKIFGSKDAMLKLDMSEYVDGISANKLVGSPPGYVGYNEGGVLTKFVQNKPYSLILFDELEKAHPDVTLLLLQILEDGRLTDSFGKVVDFKNTIIVCTSNVGVGSAKSMGFGTQSDLIKRANDNLVEEIKRVFKPEFLNRINLISFTGLNHNDALRIIDLEIGKVNKRLAENHVTVVCTDAAKEFLIKHGFDEKKGGRNVRTQVEHHIENALVDDFLLDAIPQNSVITFDVADGKLTHQVAPQATPQVKGS